MALYVGRLQSWKLGRSGRGRQLPFMEHISHLELLQFVRLCNSYLEIGPSLFSIAEKKPGSKRWDGGLDIGGRRAEMPRFAFPFGTHGLFVTLSPQCALSVGLSQVITCKMMMS